MDKFIGFDVDCKQTVACVVCDGHPDKYATLPTELPALRAWLAAQRRPGERLHLTFEVSGMAGWLYDGLVDLVEELKVSNPSQFTWIFRTTKKSDRIDGRKQAVALKLGELPTVHMPERAVRQWRSEIQHRRKLVARSCQLKNQVRGQLKSVGVRRPGVAAGWWTKATREWLRVEFAADWGLQDLLDQLELVENQLRRATRRLDERLKHHAGAAVLQSMPGVGPRTAEAVLAYTDEVERFARGKQYCAYFGLTPRLDQSGQKRKLGHISKQGPSVVRWLICESAWRAIKKSPALLQYFERVCHGQKSRRKIAIVAVARKMLSIMRAMLTTGEVFNEAMVLAQEQQTRHGLKRNGFYGPLAS